MKSFLQIAAVLMTPMLVASCTQSHNHFAFAGKSIKSGASGEPILVEIYLVQVTNDNLADAGIPDLPQSSDDLITPSKLLSCLSEPNGAAVIDMARLVCQEDANARGDLINTVYIKRTHPGSETTTYVSYDNVHRMSIAPSLIDDDHVHVKLKYSYSGIDSNSEDAEAPPEKISYSFEDSVTVSRDSPNIIGASQVGDSTLFLIVFVDLYNDLPADTEPDAKSQYVHSVLKAKTANHPCRI
jgi:hypothetical protein